MDTYPEERVRAHVRLLREALYDLRASISELIESGREDGIFPHEMVNATTHHLTVWRAATHQAFTEALAALDEQWARDHAWPHHAAGLGAAPPMLDDPEA